MGTARGHVEFRLLGPLEVVRDGKSVPVPSAKLRALLAALLLCPNQIVSIDRLAARIWGQAQPVDARRCLRTYITRLRQVLHCPGDELIRTRPGGYLINVEVEQLDLLTFERALERAAAAQDLHTESKLLDDALRQWRGPALADICSDLMSEGELPSLCERRLQAEERRVDVWLQLGLGQTVIPELRRLTTTHPFHERFWAQLMIALHRGGRRVAALETFASVATLLGSELGLGPGAELRELRDHIIAGEPFAAAETSEPFARLKVVP